MRTIKLLWSFSRPHTIIGSVISIYTLYSIICDNKESLYVPYLLVALVIGICCNVFIVGINQIADIEIDRINKPYLPLPSGVLTLKQARLIVMMALCMSLLMSLFISIYLFVIVALATAIGWAYSMPPIYLKKHHIGSAISIAFVRGVLLNAGGFLVFNYMVNDVVEMPLNVKILTLFIVVFSIGISWFKDLTDIKGDQQFNIRTLAIVYSTKSVLIAGNLLVSAAYVFSIYMKYVEYRNLLNVSTELYVLFYGHIALLVLFMVNAISIDLNKHSSIQKFYKRFWWFFFAEYLLYLIAYLF